MPITVAPHRLPGLGHLVPLLRDPFRFLESLSAHGDLVGIGLGPFTAVVVCDPYLTWQVLRDDRVFDKGGPLYDSGRNMTGEGLATCPHAKHRRQRRLLQPAFHPDRVAGYAPVMTRTLTEMVDSWHDGQIIDVKTQLRTFAGKVIAATLFNHAIPESAQNRLHHDAEVILAGVIRQVLMPEWLRRWPILGNRACAQAAIEARTILAELVSARRAEGTDHGDLFATMLTARDSDGGQLSDAEVIDHVLTFFFAGTDTAATVLAWALLLLDQHPNIAARLHAEVDTVLAGGSACHEDLPNLPFTGQVLTEVLRLRPPLWVATRTVTEDTQLGRHWLPAGTTVIYSSYLIHHRPDLYPDPDRFDPDRFDPASPHHPPRHTMVPFATGARKCIGDTFAMTEATLVLATIAARWRLRTLPGIDTRPTLAVVAQPRQLRMHATARTTPQTARSGLLHDR
ncbi:cytochrome P450 [Nocardia sp. NPDC023852]|uniref:cytochrome P450 n=1 Tax=Nocardia sp. NPDC023852 TaxID=3154697 RepID=UPI0033FAB92A